MFDPNAFPTAGIGVEFKMRAVAGGHADGKTESIDPIINGYLAAKFEPFDYLELQPPHFIFHPEFYRRIPGVPTLIHVSHLSLGSIGIPMDREFLKLTKRLLEDSKSPWVSEHISWTRFQGGDTKHFILPFLAKEIADTIVDNARQLREEMGVPVLLENAPRTLSLDRTSEQSEAEFITDVIERSECGLLLDIDSAILTAKTLGYDPLKYLACLPLERLIEIHIGDPVENWDILCYLLERGPVKAITVEADFARKSESNKINEVIGRIRALMKDIPIGRGASVLQSGETAEDERTGAINGFTARVDESHPEKMQFKLSEVAHVSYRGETVRLRGHGGKVNFDMPTRLFRFIQHFTDWQTLPSAFMLMPVADDVGLAELSVLLRGLLEEGILVSKEQTAAINLTSSVRTDSAWSNWGPAMDYFLASRTTDDTRYRSSEELSTYLAEKAMSARPPSSFKTYNVHPFYALDNPLMELNVPQARRDFLDVLMSRRSARRFSSEQLTRAELSALLFFTWGATRYDKNEIGDVFLKKTSPSGGSLHGAEVYPILMNVEGMESGVYHYSVHRHGLELLSREDPRAWLERACGGQSWICESAAVFLTTALLERAAWKYEFSRAFRVVLQDIGHLSQTFCLVATWLGLGSFTTAALRDEIFERKIGLNYLEEPVFLLNGAGKLLRGIESHERPRQAGPRSVDGE